MRVIRGAWSDETDACAGKAKQPIALVEAKADCVTERDKHLAKRELTDQSCARTDRCRTGIESSDTIHSEMQSSQLLSLQHLRLGGKYHLSSPTPRAGQLTFFYPAGSVVSLLL